jgi:hypothetical protein
MKCTSRDSRSNLPRVPSNAFAQSLTTVVRGARIPGCVVHAILTFLLKNVVSRGEGRNAMKLEMTNFQAVAAKLVVEGEVCEVAHAELSTQTETDTEIAPVIQKLGATSIAEIDWLMAEVRDAKNYLQSEGERIEQETVRYANLTQLASITARIVLDAISRWHPSRNQPNSHVSEVTANGQAVTPNQPDASDGAAQDCA